MGKIVVCGLLSMLYLALITPSCTADTDPIKTTKSIQADSIVHQAIERSYALPVNPEDQKKAIAILQEAIHHPDFHLAEDSLQALSYHRLGGYYINSTEFQLAKNYLDTAIQMQVSGSEKLMSFTLVKSYLNRAMAYDEMYQYNKALDDALQANKLIDQFPKEASKKGHIFLNIAEFYSKVKENTKAAEYFDQAKKFIKPSSLDLAEYYCSFAIFLENNGKGPKALENYDQALALYDQLPDAKVRSAPVAFNRFDLLMEMRPYAEAYPAYANYLSTFADTTRDLKNLKRIGHMNLGYENLANGDKSASEKNYKAALDLANQLTEGSHSAILATAYEGIADVAYERKRFDQAIALYHKAIKYLSIGFESDNVLELPNLRDHVIINANTLERILGFKADALWGKFNASNALADLEATFLTYQRLDELLIQIRQGYKAAMSRYYLIERTIKHYEKATKVALRLHERTNDPKYLTAAYNFASKNKAVVMLDGLQDENAQFVGIPATVLQNEKELKKEIYDLDGKIYDLKRKEKTTTAAIQTLSENRFAKTRAYENLIAELENKYPKYYELKYANSSELNIKELQIKLPDSTAVIEYFLGKDSIYIFSFSKRKDLVYHVIKKTVALEKTCMAYRKMIEKDSLFSMEAFASSSYRLYEKLLSKPLERFSPSINKLILVPDDILMLLSFETFLTRPLGADQENWTDALPYLIRDYAVSYAYSNKLLFQIETNTRISQSGGKYIGFGLEYDDYTLEAIEKIQPAQDLPQLFRGMGKLIYSDDEVLESADIMGGKTYVNARATKSNFMKEARSAGILHLVTHGYVAKENPMNSGLIFSKSISNDDFILKASDIYTLDLQAEMAVLSACHTGSGKLQKGEGVRSLARAFNYAGCPNVTASLWAAPDLSTKDIMVAYYQSLKQGHPKDASLQAAKLHYLDHCTFNIEAMPCNWAHLITIGNVEPFIQASSL